MSETKTRQGKREESFKAGKRTYYPAERAGRKEDYEYQQVKDREHRISWHIETET